MGTFRKMDGTPPSSYPSDVGQYSNAPTTTPDAGGPVDCFLRDDGILRGRATHLIKVDTAGSFSEGADLATDAQGRAVEAGSGDVVVAGALESSFGSGDKVWAVWRYGR